MSEDINQKKFTPFDKGIKLVSKPNDIDPETLTNCCKAQLDKGRTEFKCPLCVKEWPYNEVRKLAKLTVDEQSSFEEKLGTNTVKILLDFRDCPGCSTLIERSDNSNLCVLCSVCTATNKKTYEFCWRCMREWKGPQTHAEHCGNEGCCIDEKLLKECPMITLQYFEQDFFDAVVKCPKLRKCPYCDTMIEHANEGCNNMPCPDCNTEFCFICLNPAHDYDYECPCTLAPKQIKTVL
ncbi:uncharacterized protein DDB_G0292642-like isoform X2 [Triplophysa dalaica]|uniref:uncharacterized protein DDB_G0292642-like isoform X2 n=1 Tax=Triplophysa dalaica TaxID=1582913 RepID=UPI0024DFB97E|nr:uncharacterized protein DDB_G0292642-like isoform X2 [Triplophysa dalaica]